MDELKDYDQLSKSYKKLQIELEQVNQALYDYKRQMRAAQTIESEYQEEIKLLQTQGTIEQQKLEARVLQLEEAASTLKSEHNERVTCLEKELFDKDEEVKELKRQLDDIVRISEAKDVSIDDRLIDEISDLKESNLQLSEQVSDLEKQLEGCHRENLTLGESVKRLEEELESYKENLTCKREELGEAHSVIQNLKDEVLCLQSELEQLKSRPLDDKSKGNSLFAEVDDRRVQLQQNMTTMKKQYLEMKSDRANLLKQISTLRNENRALIAQWEAEVVGRKYDEEMILDTYKNQIQTLNELIESYQSEIKKNSLESPNSQEMKFFDNMLAMKNEEIENLRKKLSTRSLTHTSLSYDLAEANRQIRKCNLDNLQLKNEIGGLKLKIQEMELVREKAPEEKETLPKSIVKSAKIEEEVDVNKENESKKVQFCENTVEPHITDRNKYRKGAKVLVSKPVMYS